MRILGVRTVKLARLLLPGDMPARQKTGNAKDLAAGLKKWGKYIHDPLVREEDMRIIAGRDRIAGAMLEGRAELDVKLCDCSDEEAEELELVENLHRRRDNEAELRQRHLDLLERQAKARAKEPNGIRAPTPRGEAREELAKQLGVSKNALEQQESRRRKKEVDQQNSRQASLPGWGEEEEAPPPPPPVELLGTAPKAEFLTGVSEVQGMLDEADKLARGLQSVLTRLQGARLALPAARWQRLYKAAHTLAHDIRAARPVSVCAFCKLTPLLQGTCTACNRAGYLSEQDMPGVPKELLVVDDRLVSQSGRFVPMDKVSPETAPAGRPPRRRVALVEDEDGNTREVEIDRE